MNELLKLIQQESAIKAFTEGKASFSHLSPTQEAILLAASYRLDPRPIFVVKSNLYQAQHLHAKLQLWLNDEELSLFAVEESLRVEAIASSPEINVQKMETMSKLSSGVPILCITHSGAAVRNLPLPNYFKTSTLHLKSSQLIDLQSLQKQLRDIGYTSVNRVDQPCCYASRGGIIDIFPINSEFPVRIEFFDNEIESLRYFDLSSQRTTELIDKIRIQPATDILFTPEQIVEIHERVEALLLREASRRQPSEMMVLEENIRRDLDYIDQHIKENHLYQYTAALSATASIFDYTSDPLVILSSVEEVKTHLHTLTEETVDYIQERSSDNKALPLFSVFHDLPAILGKYQRTDFHQFETMKQEVQYRIHDAFIPQQTLPLHVKLLGGMVQKQHVICCLKEAEIKQLIPLLIEAKLPYTMVLDRLDEPHLTLLHHDWDEGFEISSRNILVLTSKELFNHKTVIGRYSNKFKEAETLSTYQDLQVGDYVVHHQHGVGRYLGIITREMEGVHKDFLHIVYRGDDTLLVPLEQFQLVRKFVSREGVVPKLNKLGSNEWVKTKAKIRENVKDIADRLINLYSKRETGIGYTFGPDSELQKEFEDEFEFPLTLDQEVAITEIKQDMMSAKPMDRLLCGDVGFGKTEVAIRVAFKAVAEHKQVAFLCPTTVLARQHYQTFLHRFANYPVNIAVLNRFVVESRQKEIVKEVKEGKIDILIGTHRLLSKDVKFKDLGLLVIDEEQRFGVEHKEKIKEVRASVDVLSLSATPIPRTLQMSLIGVRSLSQLETPPLNRLPVQTYVLEKNRGVIKEVIQRELARNGQVFYLFNNVAQIYSVAYQIKQDIPEASVAVAHGQMNREEIEDVMFRFTQNEYNVMVCTTIIETGIDIPNANTMIIDKADTFGLSQLYQIKGRVGRSDRLAYAYLMYTPRKQLSEIAMKRLQSIKEFTELGSGYKIAMRDLTIRGAGEMLGDSQSGFIDTVGIDMYIEMLQQAINEKRTGIAVPEEIMIAKPNYSVDAYIPQPFAPQDYEKITLYQRIDKAENQHELKKLQEEIADMYGKLPKSVALLFEKKRLEILISEPRIKSFKELKTHAQLVFSAEWSSHIDGVRLFKMISDISPEITLKYAQGNIIVNLPKSQDWLTQATTILDKTAALPLKGENHANR